MEASKDKALDAKTFAACREALKHALPLAQQWKRPREDPYLKAKIVLLIVKRATGGERDPATLSQYALANYVRESVGHRVN